MRHPYIVAYWWNMYLYRSFLPFCFVCFFSYQQPIYLPCLPVLVSCFVSVLCFFISSLLLVAILSCIHTYTLLPALGLPKRAILHLDLFVTLCWVIYHICNNLSQTKHARTSNTMGNHFPSTCHSTITTFTTNWPTEMACLFGPPPPKPNTTRTWYRTHSCRYACWHSRTYTWGFQYRTIIWNRRPDYSYRHCNTRRCWLPEKIFSVRTASSNYVMSRHPCTSRTCRSTTTNNYYSSTRLQTNVKPIKSFQRHSSSI